MIPMKLEFKKPEFDDIEHLSKFYCKRPDKTCDSVILDSFLWRDYYDVLFALRDDEAVLWEMTVDGKLYAALPVCDNDVLQDNFDFLEKYFNEELGQPLEIYLASEDLLPFLDLPEDKYSIAELPDSRDYLYNADALRTLSGRKLHKKKNHLNSFLKEYDGRYEYRTLKAGDRDEVFAFLDKWREQKDQTVEGTLDPEVAGIHEVLKYCEDFVLLNVHMGGIYIDGKLEAFSIGSYNPYEKMAVIHIEKANPDIVGLYQVINQQFLINEFPEAELVNREDDLGLPGLRQAKESYAPIGYARKYRIRQLRDF